MSDDEANGSINHDEWAAAQMAQGDQAATAAAEIARIISSFMKKLDKEGHNPYEQLELAKVYLATMLSGGQS
ncbi:MAG: hypothetical protein ITG02_01125 [Patulibacter sp.]|nr:hypothetical protein [Patulibacter sp.]